MLVQRIRLLPDNGWRLGHHCVGATTHGAGGQSNCRGKQTNQEHAHCYGQHKRYLLEQISQMSIGQAVNGVCNVAYGQLSMNNLFCLYDLGTSESQRFDVAVL